MWLIDTIKSLIAISVLGRLIFFWHLEHWCLGTSFANNIQYSSLPWDNWSQQLHEVGSAVPTRMN